MRTLNFVLIAIIPFLLIVSCEKNEWAQEPGKKSTMKSRINNLAQTLSVEDFEEDLNVAYVTNPGIVSIPQLDTFSFTHSNGTISTIEQTRIDSMIQEIIEDGADPRVIDLNISTNLVELLTDITSELSFGFHDDVRPNGGLLGNGMVLAGNWCNGSTDLGGGGCGRVARAFMNIAVSNDLLYYKNIKEMGVVGHCEDDVYDEWNTFGYIEISDTDFWHYKSTCENSKPLCLSAENQQDYLDVLEDLVDQYLPTGYERIGFKIAKYEAFPSTPANYYWYFWFKVGIPVYDNQQ